MPVGYDVHITRRDDWWDKEGVAISAGEWNAIVAADPAMETVGRADAATLQGEAIRYDSPGLAIWSRSGSDPAWFDLRGGNIVVKSPDEATLRKMIELAEHLDAKVQGDEGELYE